LLHISERVLGHAIAGVENVYDQHSYEDEKAGVLKALERINEHHGVPPPDNVVPIWASQ
jgi:hypothetical protein